MNILMISTIDKYFAMGEELEFFGHFLLASEEVLVVGLTDIGEYADGGLDDVLQACHLTGFGDASLEDGHIVLAVHLPDGERDAYL